MPSDRARPVTPGTGLERLERHPERIWDGFRNGNPCFRQKFPSTWGFIGKHLGMSQIRTCHRMELVRIHLEPGWNASDTLLNEYGTVSIIEIHVFGRKTAVFGILLEYTWEYRKSENTIGWSSSSYIWNHARTLRTPCWTNMGRFQQWKSLFSVEKPQYSEFYWNTHWNIKNLNMPSDRARPFTPRTGLERLEHLSEWIWDGFNNGNPCFR